MMQIVYYAASSLDHYIARKDGSVDWLDPFMDSDADIEAFYGSVDGIVMGSGTYEFALAHPPWLAPDKPSWIFTNRPLPLADPSVTLTKSTPQELVSELKSKGLKKIWLMGGGKLASAFREGGLITDYEIAMIPVILGRGIPLLTPSSREDNLKLIGCKTFKSGIVALSYQSNHNA